MFAYYFYLHVYLHNCAPFVIIMHIHLFASHLHLMFVGLDDMVTVYNIYVNHWYVAVQRNNTFKRIYITRRLRKDIY